MKDLITIVVPVYNTHDYLGKCLDSLLCQTYKDIQIICIDDGSTDDSKDLIGKYIRKDERVSYYYQENGGAASSRNHGIDLFMKDKNTDHIIFVDSDDFVEKDFVETLYDTLIKYDADIATCNMKAEGEKTQGDRSTSVYDRRNCYICISKIRSFWKHRYARSIKRRSLMR